MRTHKVYLHGRLRRRFGGPFELGASTPALAVRALMRLLPGFREAMSRGSFRVIRGARRTGVALSEPMLGLGLGCKALHIVPAAVGAKGIGKVILGTLIIAAAVVTALPSGGGSLAFGTSALFGLTTAGSVGLFGAAILFSGITSLLTPKIKRPEQGTADSYSISGPINSTQEGAPVPLVYGRMRVGSTVIAASYVAEGLQAQGSGNIFGKATSG